MTDQNNALIVRIAQIIDYPSVYMGGPSRNSLRIAETIVKEFGADLARADRAAPMEICSKCMGTGTAGHPDSGYTCDCNGGMVAAPTDNTALVEAAYHAGIDAAANRYRVCASLDVWDYFYTAYNAMLDLKTFPMPAALASREAPPASDSGEKPLCPVCYNRTDAELRTIGGFYSMESNCPECSHRAKERAKQDADREALVRLLQIITRNGSLDDGRTLHEVIADALLARGLRPPACQQEAVTEALQDMLQAVCGDTGFAACVRQESGKAYPWPALDLAEAKALRALKGES